MNVEVIRAAVNVVPEVMNMSDWISDTACGTVACIAGNCVIQHQSDDEQSIRGAARQLMGLSQDEASRLFYVYRWPRQFRSEHDCDMVADADGKPLTPGTPEYLDRVKARVEHFIATGGAE